MILIWTHHDFEYLSSPRQTENNKTQRNSAKQDSESHRTEQMSHLHSGTKNWNQT